MTTSSDHEHLSDGLLPRSRQQLDSIHQRQRELLSRIGSSQRTSALRLSVSGKDDAARQAEISAEAVRFEMESPESARRVRSVMAALNHLQEGHDLYQQALEGALSLVGAERGNIQLCDQMTGSLTIAAQVGFDREFLEHFAVVDDEASACGRAAKQQTQTVIADVHKDPAFAPHREIADASGFRAVCSTPLVGRQGQLVGMLSLHYPRPYRPSGGELQTLRRFGQRLVPLLDQEADEAPAGISAKRRTSTITQRGRWTRAIIDARMSSADMAERMADQADQLASILEEAARRGDSPRRLALASREREVAAIQRRNAEELRRAGSGPVTLAPMPSLLEPDL